jgi:hypothetical protein
MSKYSADEVMAVADELADSDTFIGGRATSMLRHLAAAPSAPEGDGGAG